MADSTQEADLRWACEQIEKYRATRPRYVTFAQTLRQVLEQAARRYAPEAIVQTRAKSIASFAEKIQRKKAKYRDPVNQITDLCGGRVITHTPEEVKAICAFIEQHFDVDRANTIDVSQRLKPTEFGYRSVHYIVQFRPGIFPTKDINVAIPQEVLGLKAEIQVRTILEHAWADFNHRLVYKSPFPVPARWQREFAGLAAMLERVDNAFAAIEAGLKTYAANYGAYMSEEQMREEMALLETVLACDPQNAELAHRIGKLAIALGDWPKAIEVLSPYVPSGYPPILRDLGVALCKQHRADPESPPYRQGRAYLEAACAPPCTDADALASLAGTWKGIDDRKAKEYYRQAFELDPTDPYPFGNYLECEIVESKDISVVRLLTPAIQAAIRRCRDQADVGVNLPWAFYDMGKLYLLLGKPYESLTAYARAVRLSTKEWMVETSLRSLDRLSVVEEALPGHEWARRLLLLGWGVKFPHPAVLEQVSRLASPGHPAVAGPVVILSGGCDASVEQEMQTYRRLLREGFRDFRGTLICGGTMAGISGLAGEVQQAYPAAIRTIGYIPQVIPAGVTVDERYGEIRRTTGHDFSPLEALQYWTDLVASGISPEQVRLLGINGGAIAAAEYRLALALGARVAVIEGSGRAVAQLLADEDWHTSSRLLRLPADAMTVRAFIGSGNPRLEPELRESLGRAIHEAFRQLQAGRRASEDPSLAEWNALLENLKESNRQQADHMAEKLRQIGCTVHRVASGQVSPITFTESEVEVMAEMEHGRWVAERLLDGWTRGEKRDVYRKTNPYLVPWSALPDDVKEWDRETVRRIPEFLAKVGLEIRRQA
ncbi:MAG: RyR domain-containing protein [Anaerolineae bacterium]|nr:RyR domain-containing protein [Anaerolineae bacterium]